jgi:hypothetical protein
LVLLLVGSALWSRSLRRQVAQRTLALSLEIAERKRTEQDLRDLEKKEKELHLAVKENERLKKEMEQVLRKEKHQQQVELLKEQNRVSEERIAYLKDMERKLKQLDLLIKRPLYMNETPICER